MHSTRSMLGELTRLLDAATVPAYVVDDDYVLVYCNRATADLAGLGVEELIGRRCRFAASGELTGADAVAAALCPPPQVLDGQMAHVPLVMTAADGTPRDLTAAFLPLGAAAEKIPGVIAVLWPTVAGAAVIDDEAAMDQLHARVQRYRRDMGRRYHVDQLVGTGPRMSRVRAQVSLAAGTDASVLIYGPPGSGRQHVGRAIHYSRNLPEPPPLLPLACATLDADTLRSQVSKVNRSESAGAARATLLLCDADALSSEVQAELVRLVNGAQPLVRIVSTARGPLTDSAERGQYRDDLACALSTQTIELPPLAERPEDVPLLAQWFLERANATEQKQLGSFTPEALDLLVLYLWPRNVEELADVVRHAHRQAGGTEITVRDLPRRLHLAADAAARPRPGTERIQLEELLERVERELIGQALNRAKGNKTKAAELLGITRPRLYRRLVQLGFESP